MDEYIRIHTAQNVDIEYEIASIGDRISAFFIDFLICTAYFLLIAYALNSLSRSNPYVYSVILMAPIMFYDLIFEIFMNGQSVGKRLREIKVAKLDGTQPTLGSYLLRWILRPIDVWVSSGAIGLATILLRGTGQRLGDMAAGSAVIKLKQRVSLADTILERVETDYEVAFPEVEMLKDSDIEIIKEVLRAYNILDDKITREKIIREAQVNLEKRLGIQSNLVPRIFLERVIKDYNYIKGAL